VEKLAERKSKNGADNDRIKEKIMKQIAKKKLNISNCSF
jgi:hypothetical protein